MQNDVDTPAAPEDLGALGTQVAEALPPELLEVEAPEPDTGPAPYGWSVGVAGIAAALIATLGVLVEDRATVGPWQGFLLRTRDALPAPLPPYWHACIDLVAHLAKIPVTVAALLLASLSLVLLCGLVAALTTELAKRFTPRGNRTAISAFGVQVFSGVAAAFLFQISYIVRALAVDGSPAMFSAAMALLGILLCLHAQQRARISLALLASAACIGMAAADQPYFLVVALSCLLRMLAFGVGEGSVRIEKAVGGLLAFAVLLLWPALRFLQTGHTFPVLVDHLLKLPLPDASFAPEAFAPHLAHLVPLGAWVVFAIAMLFALWVGGRPRMEALFFGGIALLLCPGMAYLATAPGAALIPIDYDAPRLLAVALLTATGFAVVHGLTYFSVPSAVDSAWPVVFFVCSVYQSTNFVPHIYKIREPEQRAHTEALLAQAPEGATLIVGDLNTAGMLWGLQSVESLRPDLHIVPGIWLDTPRGRSAANAVLGDAHPIDVDFPTPAALNRWQQELPLQLAAMQGSSATEFADGLHSFALWDLVSEAAPGESIYFLGESAPWLRARAQLRGEFLVYPPGKTSVPAADAATMPDGATPAFRAMQSQWLGALDDAMTSHRTDVIDSVLHPDAKRGKPTDPLGIVGVKALETAQQANGILSGDLRAQTDELWRADLLHVLRAVYETLAAVPKPDAEVHYQLAAVYAQLGLWKETGEAVERWLTTFPEGNGTAYTRLSGDGRFALYLRHAVPTQQHQTGDSAPADHTTEPQVVGLGFGE